MLRKSERDECVATGHEEDRIDGLLGFFCVCKFYLIHKNSKSLIITLVLCMFHLYTSVIFFRFHFSCTLVSLGMTGVNKTKHHQVCGIWGLAASRGNTFEPSSLETKKTSQIGGKSHGSGNRQQQRQEKTGRRRGG